MLLFKMSKCVKSYQQKFNTLVNLDVENLQELRFLYRKIGCLFEWYWVLFQGRLYTRQVQSSKYFVGISAKKEKKEKEKGAHRA